MSFTLQDPQRQTFDYTITGDPHNSYVWLYAGGGLLAIVPSCALLRVRRRHSPETAELEGVPRAIAPGRSPLARLHGHAFAGPVISRPDFLLTIWTLDVAPDGGLVPCRARLPPAVARCGPREIWGAGEDPGPAPRRARRAARHAEGDPERGGRALVRPARLERSPSRDAKRKRGGGFRAERRWCTTLAPQERRDRWTEAGRTECCRSRSRMRGREVTVRSSAPPSALEPNVRSISSCRVPACTFPTPGYSGAGEVVAVGSGVTHLRLGDRVAVRGAPHASSVTVPESAAHPVPPESISPQPRSSSSA